jgi:trypsin
MSARSASAAVLAVTVAVLTAAPGARAAAADALIAPPTAHASIVNGYIPDASQWPWMTALLYTPEFKPDYDNDFDRQFCGGTLLRPKVVLTAAHCIRATGIRGPQDLDVLLARRNLRESVGEKIHVAQIVVHPGYDPQSDRNDVAILHLASPSTMVPASIIAPGTRLKEGQRATVMGWGALANAAIFSPALHAADVPLWSPRRCGQAWKGEYVATLMLCAGYLNGKVDSCQGDSGGPLMVLDRARAWQLLGVVSFGAKCAQPQLPGVYAWVNAAGIREFIAGEVAKDTTPPGTGTAPATSGSQPTAPPADDRRAPRLRPVRLGAARNALIVRTRTSEAAQVSAAVLTRGGRRVHGPVRRSVRAGRVRLRIPGRLRPGRYRVLVSAVDLALNRSARSVRLRVTG